MCSSTPITRMCSSRVGSPWVRCRHAAKARVQVFFQPIPRPRAQAFTLMPSVAMRCRIQRVTRRVTVCRSSAACGIDARKMPTLQSSLPQTSRGTRTCRTLGCPAMGRSVSRRSTWSRTWQSRPQPGQVVDTDTGWQYRWVTSPASAALSILRPSSAVRQIVSATRFGTAESVTVGWDMDPGVAE